MKIMEEHNYTRNEYLKRIIPFINKPVIKVITGMRRVGKSTFLKLIISHLRNQGVAEENILYINKELLSWDHIKNVYDLNEEVTAFFTGKEGPCYLFVDEVQEISQWEKALASFLAERRIDLFVTGSNAHLLSSELATYISGRYVEFPIFSLSFKEFLVFRRGGSSLKESKESIQIEFSHFLRYGGFPGVHFLDLHSDIVYQYISSLFNTILLKDVVKRNNIRNISLLEDITKFVFDNIGNIFSIKRVTDFLKNQKRSTDHETVRNYLGYLEASFAIYKVPRYDIKGKRHLEMYEKYFVGDIGLRHALLGYKEQDIAGLLENLVFLKLKQSGYSVSIGKFGDQEIDFIGEKHNERLYIQVCYMLGSEETIRREFSPLQQIPDNFPKLVLSLDPYWANDVEGIKRRHLVDFLLDEEP